MEAWTTWRILNLYKEVFHETGAAKERSSISPGGGQAHKRLLSNSVLRRQRTIDLTSVTSLAYLQTPITFILHNLGFLTRQMIAVRL